MNLIKKEKPACLRGRILKYYNPSFTIHKRFTQVHNFLPLGFLLKKIVHGLSSKNLGEP